MEEFVDPVDGKTEITLLLVSISKIFVPPPFFTKKASVSETVTCILLVAAIVPVAEDKEAFKILNPEMLDENDVDVFKLPAIPAPPATIKAPVVVDVEPVVE